MVSGLCAYVCVYISHSKRVPSFDFVQPNIKMAFNISDFHAIVVNSVPQNTKSALIILFHIIYVLDEGLTLPLFAHLNVASLAQW